MTSRSLRPVRDIAVQVWAFQSRLTHWELTVFFALASMHVTYTAGLRDSSPGEVSLGKGDAVGKYKRSAEV